MFKRAIAVLAIALAIGCNAAAPPEPTSTLPEVSLSPSDTPSATPTTTPGAASQSPSAPTTPEPTLAPTAVPTSAASATPDPTPTAQSSAPPPTVRPIGTWTANRVDGASPGGYPGYDMLSMALDAEGHVHVAEDLHDGIYYVTNRDGNWSRTRISTAPPHGTDSQPSLAIDTVDDTVYIAFTRWSVYDPCIFGCRRGPRFQLDGIYLAHDRLGPWTLLPEPIAPGMAQPSMQVNDLRTYLAFVEESPDGESSRIVYRTDDAEEPQTIVVTENGSDPQLLLASDGTPRIMFGRGEALGYAVTGSVSGPFLVSDGPQPTPSSRPEFALDGNDQPHVAWESDLSVMYSTLVGGTWSEPVEIFAEGMLGGIDVDRNGTVHAVTMPRFGFPDEESAGIWYAFGSRDAFSAAQPIRESDGMWETEGARFPSAIELDPLGQAHVVFSWIDEPEGLWYAVGPRP